MTRPNMPGGPAGQQQQQEPQARQERQQQQQQEGRAPSPAGVQHLAIGGAATLSFLTVLLYYGPRIAALVAEIANAMRPADGDQGGAAMPAERP